MKELQVLFPNYIQSSGADGGCSVPCRHHSLLPVVWRWVGGQGRARLVQGILATSLPQLQPDPLTAMPGGAASSTSVCSGSVSGHGGRQPACAAVERCCRRALAQAPLLVFAPFAH